MIQGALTEKDYVEAQFLHLRPRPIFAIAGVLLVLLFAWAAYADRSLGLAAILCYLGLYYLVYVPWKTRRSFRQAKAISGHAELHIRDDGVFFKDSYSEGIMPWNHILKWKASSKLVLLYPVRGVFYIVPAHFFETNDEFLGFQVKLTNHVGKASV